MKRATLYLPEEMQRKLVELAGRDGVSQATLIRTAVDRFLEQLERIQPVGVAEESAVYEARTSVKRAWTSVRKTTMYFPEETHRRLGDVSRHEGRSQAELIREAIEEFLAAAERPWPRSIGAGEDPELSGGEVRDWLRRTWAQHA